MVRENKPAGLFAYFKEHGTKLMNPYKGIYYVMDTVMFPTQIIVTRELNLEEHVWLKALSGGMQKQQMQNLLEKIEKLDLKFDRELADSVLQVSVKANKQVVEELRGEKHMCEALLEIMEPEINKIKERTKEEVTKEVTEEVTREVTREVTEEVTREVRQKSIRSAVAALRIFGHENAEVKDAIMKAYSISASEAEEYL